MAEEILVYIQTENSPLPTQAPFRFEFAEGATYQIPQPVHELDTIEVLLRRPERDARYSLHVGSKQFEPTLLSSGLMWEAQKFLANYRGWVSVQVARQTGEHRAVTEISFACLPSKITEDQYRVMLEEIESVSRWLLLDVVGGRKEVGWRGRTSASEFTGMSEHEAIAAVMDKIRPDLHRLAEGQGRELRMERERTNCWSVDRLDARAIMELTSSGVDPRRPANLPFRCTIPKWNPTTDVHENRQIAAFLRSLIDRVGFVIDNIDLRIDQLDEDRWWRDNAPFGQKSIWESEDVPRRQSLERVGEAARALRRSIQRDLRPLPHLSTASGALDLRPTSLFLRHPVYARLYRVMLAFLRTHGAVFDRADFETQARSKGTDKLYEYWVFLSIVRYFQERAKLTASEYGQLYERSANDGSYVLNIERSYVTFRLDEARTLRVYYSPLIFRREEAQRRDHPFYRLGDGLPYSPDFLIEVRRGDQLQMGVILDAKYMSEVSRELRDLQKYLPAIRDARTGEVFSRMLWIVYVGDPNAESDTTGVHVEAHTRRPVFLRNDVSRIEVTDPEAVVLGSLRYAPSPWATPDSSLDQLEPLFSALLAELGVKPTSADAAKRLAG